MSVSRAVSPNFAWVISSDRGQYFIQGYGQFRVRGEVNFELGDGQFYVRGIGCFESGGESIMVKFRVRYLVRIDSSA